MIEASDLTVSFRRGRFGRQRVKALDGFGVRVERGDVVALLGPNGCGKSTAMHTMLGLVRPERGSVRIAGARPYPGSPIHDRIAYLPEEPHYHDYLTVEESLRYYTGLYREPPSDRRIQEALRSVGLDGDRGVLLRKCSKGMKQKVGIAVCLATDPDVLFLDEPMRGLDPQAVRLFRDALARMASRGATIVLSSHILAEVEMICTHVAIMRSGRVLRQAAVEEFRGLDLEHYVVELAIPGGAPESLHVTERRAECIVGTVPASRLQELVGDVETAGGRLLSAHLSRRSLEEAFLASFREGEDDG